MSTHLKCSQGECEDKDSRIAKLEAKVAKGCELADALWEARQAMRAVQNVYGELYGGVFRGFELQASEALDAWEQDK